MGGLGEEALLVLVTRTPRNGASWDPEWFIFTYYLRLGWGGGVGCVKIPELDAEDVGSSS